MLSILSHPFCLVDIAASWASMFPGLEPWAVLRIPFGVGDCIAFHYLNRSCITVCDEVRVAIMVNLFLLPADWRVRAKRQFQKTLDAPVRGEEPWEGLGLRVLPFA